MKETIIPEVHFSDELIPEFVLNALVIEAVVLSRLM